jgi:serine/threonine protein kinase
VSSSLVGQTLGQYKILEQLGAGGMGVVYKAQDVRLGRLVAIKVLPQATAENEEALERFRREARTASSLNHPSICTIYGFDEHEGQLYLAMELLDGEPLDRKLAGRPLELRALLDLGMQIADALDAAHGEGVLHRDIKPANVFVTRKGQAKVLDFGLAKLTRASELHPEDRDLTVRFSSLSGTTVGTISYMSPEQARGEDLDPRTDLFSFGVVLYEMATGQQSFPGATTAVVFDNILNREPALPSTVNGAVPAELDRIISKALEKDRELRYQSAADMRADLQRLKRDSTARTASAPALASAVASSGSAPLNPSDAQTVMGVPSWATPTQAVPSARAAAVPPAPPLVASPAETAVPPTRKWSPLTLAAGALFLTALVVALAVARVARDRVNDIADAVDFANSEPPPPALDVTLDTAPPTPPPGPTADVVPDTAPPKVQPETPASTATSPPAPPETPETSKPAPSRPAPSRPSRAEVAATERLDVARAKVANGLLEPALVDLRQIILDFAGTTTAAEASFLSAEVLEKLGRLDDAMAVHVEFNTRFGGDRRVAASKLRLAEMTARSRRPDRDNAVRDLLGEIIAAHPGTPQAFQALQMRIRIDAERRQREIDPVLGVAVPAVVPTLRTFTEQFPNAPAAMPAFNRLALVYIELEQYERAAQALTALATNFPSNPLDAWFRAGEIYERRLKDLDRARQAYARVPPGSARYRDAQRRLRDR